MKSALGSLVVSPLLLKPRTRVKFALLRVTESRKSLRFTLPLGAVLARVAVAILLELIAVAIIDA